MNMEKTFDLAEIQAEAKQENVLEILHPVSQIGIGLKIRIASPDSEKYRKLAQAMRTKIQAMMQRNKGKMPPTEVIEEESQKVLIGAVLGWEGATWGGQPFECTPDNVKQLFDALPWIKEQVDEYLGNRANFFKS